MTNPTSRLVYTAGTLRLSDEMRQARRLIVRTDVLRRPPSARYQNERSNPTKWFFGYYSLWIGDYVHYVAPLEFENQMIFLWDNLHLQNNHAIYCNTGKLTDNIVALGTAMTPPAVLVAITPEVPSFPGCPYDWIKFKLEPLTRIQVTASWEPAQACADITVPVSLPEITDNVDPYPSDRPLSFDPERSSPEPGEKPGDTTQASLSDPDISLLAEATLSVTYDIGANGSLPGASPVTLTFQVPNDTYIASLADGNAPSTCAGIAGLAVPNPPKQRTVALSASGDEIELFVHNTCNLLSIISQTYI